jgi:hypothetical protein
VERLWTLLKALDQEAKIVIRAKLGSRAAARINVGRSGSIVSAIDFTIMDC